MNILQKSEAIKAGLRKSFQDGSSKMAQRKCYGYDVDIAGCLVIDPYEAAVVLRIFEMRKAGSSLGQIAADLERRKIPSPTGKSKWSREAINKLLSNEKYTGRVLLQKTVSTGISQIKNDGIMDQYLYTGTHDAIISDELFAAVQPIQERVSRTHEKGFAISQTF